MNFRSHCTIFLFSITLEFLLHLFAKLPVRCFLAPRLYLRLQSTRVICVWLSIINWFLGHSWTFITIVVIKHCSAVVMAWKRCWSSARADGATQTPVIIVVLIWKVAIISFKTFVTIVVKVNPLWASCCWDPSINVFPLSIVLQFHPIAYWVNTLCFLLKIR